MLSESHHSKSNRVDVVRKKYDFQYSLGQTNVRRDHLYDRQTSMELYILTLDVATGRQFVPRYVDRISFSLPLSVFSRVSMPVIECEHERR